MRRGRSARVFAARGRGMSGRRGPLARAPADSSEKSGRPEAPSVVSGAPLAPAHGRLGRRSSIARGRRPSNRATRRR